MKKFTFMFNRLIFLIPFILIICLLSNVKVLDAQNRITSGTCSYSVVAYDDYGDGWSGGTLTITQDGIVVLDQYTLEDGDGPETVSFEVTDGGLLEAQFNCGGDCAECYYEILDTDGNIIFVDGEEYEPEGGVIGTAHCAAVNSCSYSVVAYDDYGDGWSGGTLTITQDGIVVLDQYTLEDGDGPETVSFEVTDGGLLEAQFNCGGDCAECYYEILDTDGNIIFVDGEEYEPEGGVIGTAVCNAPINSDVEVIAINSAETIASGINHPKAVVKNNGLIAASFDVQLTINGIYSSIKTVNDLLPDETIEVAFEAWDAPTGNYVLNVCTLLDGDENSDNNCMEMNVSVIVSDIFYAYSTNDPTGTTGPGPIRFLQADPETSVFVISPTTSSNFIAGACWANDNWYGSQYNGGLYTIDENTGEMIFIGQTESFNGLAYDELNDVMYGASSTMLYEVDPATASYTLIGEMGNSGSMIGIACDPSGKLYGVDVSDRNLYEIDVNTGNATVVGSLNINIVYAQDMAWDLDNNVLYLAAYTAENSSELYTCDPLTAACELVGAFPDDFHITGFAIPYQNTTYENDMAVQSIVSPETDENLGIEAVTIIIKNLGLLAKSDIPVYYTINGGTAVQETITATVEPNMEIEYTFSTAADLSEWGTDYNINVCINDPEDENPENNCKEVVVSNLTPCILEIPDDAVYEAENCGEAINNGCEMGSPAFESISDGLTVAGSVWYNGPDYNGDTDWFVFSTDDPKEITITANAEFPYILSVYDITDGCDDYFYHSITVDTEYEKCTEAFNNFYINEPGEYAIVVQHKYAPETILGCEDYNSYWLHLEIDSTYIPTYCVDGLYSHNCDEPGVPDYGMSYLNINNTSFDILCDGAPTYKYDWYHDYTSTIVDIKDLDEIIVATNYYSIYLVAWIDFNNDTLMLDNEKVIDNHFMEMPGIHEVSLLLPDDLPDGNYTMRIRTTIIPLVDACDQTLYGNMVDLTVEVGLDAAINLDPESLHKTLLTGTTDTETLTIANTGEGVLNYEFVINLEDNRSELYNTKMIRNDTKQHDIIKISKSEQSVAPLASRDEEVVLMYDNGINDGQIGLDNNNGFMVAAYWPSSVMSSYTGMLLDQVEVYIADVGSAEFDLIIWDEGSSEAPGQILVQQAFSPEANNWHTIQLVDMVEITGNDIWIGYAISNTTAGNHYAGNDSGPAASGYGDMISIDGEWFSLSGLGYNYNWNIHARLLGDFWFMPGVLQGSVLADSIAEIEITFDALEITEGHFEGSLLVYSNDPLNPELVIPVTMDVLAQEWPLVFEVTGSGTYCDGSAGIAVELSGSEYGIYYTLFKDGVAQENIVEGTGEPISFGPQLEGTYTVTATSFLNTIDMNGSAVITAIEPVTPAIAIVASANPVISGDEVTITATPEHGGNSPVFQWFVNDVYLADDNPFVYIPDDGDQIYAVLISSEECVTVTTVSSNLIEMVVNEVYAQISVEPDLLEQVFNMPNGQATDILTIGNQGEATLNWNAEIEYLTPAGVSAWLDLSSSGGSIAPENQTSVDVIFDAGSLTENALYTANLLVNSNDPETPQVVIPVSMALIVGLDDNAQSDIQVYPNPASNLLNIKNMKGVRSIRMLNSLGQIVLNKEVKNQDSMVIGTGDFQVGIYLLHFTYQDGKSIFETIVIRR